MCLVQSADILGKKTVFKEPVIPIQWQALISIFNIYFVSSSMSLHASHRQHPVFLTIPTFILFWVDRLVKGKTKKIARQIKGNDNELYWNITYLALSTATAIMDFWSCRRHETDTNDNNGDDDGNETRHFNCRVFSSYIFTELDCDHEFCF